MTSDMVDVVNSTCKSEFCETYANPKYHDLYMGFSAKFIYIRFNPDSYNDKNNIKHNPLIEDRFDALKLEIDRQINRIKKSDNDELVEIVNLFYDE